MAEKDEALTAKLAELEAAQKEAADKSQELASATESHESTRAELQTHQARVSELEEQLKELDTVKQEAADKAKALTDATEAHDATRAELETHQTRVSDLEGQVEAAKKDAVRNRPVQSVYVY